MKLQSPLWSGISLLVSIVLLILALVRGAWLVPLLLTVFVLWWLLLFATQLLPVWRGNLAYRRRARQQYRSAADMEAEGSGSELPSLLLRHVNYRVSAVLKSAYPNVRWEWAIKNPAAFAARGGTGRIRIFGVPDYEFADVVLDETANLRCDLVKVVPINPDNSGNSRLQEDLSLDPQVWYELRGRQVLDRLIPDLHSRGHSSLTIHADGGITVQDEAGGARSTGEALLDLPDQMYWPQLVNVLKSEGFGADAQEHGIQVSW